MPRLTYLETCSAVMRNVLLPILSPSLSVYFTALDRAESYSLFMTHLTSCLCTVSGLCIAQILVVSCDSFVLYVLFSQQANMLYVDAMMTLFIASSVHAKTDSAVYGWEH